MAGIGELDLVDDLDRSGTATAATAARPATLAARSEGEAENQELGASHMDPTRQATLLFSAMPARTSADDTT